MSDTTLRLPNIGKYLRDRYVDTDARLQDKIAEGLKSVASEDREKVANPFGSLYRGVRTVFPMIPDLPGPLAAGPVTPLYPGFKGVDPYYPAGSAAASQTSTPAPAGPGLLERLGNAAQQAGQKLIPGVGGATRAMESVPNAPAPATPKKPKK